MKRLLPFLLALVIAVPAFSARAAQPQLLLTWSTQSYAPTWYQGKLLPGLNSTIRVSAQLLDGGKVVDMSKYPVQWRLNDHTLVSTSTAAVLFKTTDQFASNYIVEARIKQYLNGPDITGSVTIPRVQPLLTIDVGYPNNLLPRTPVRLRALPFFFSISKLSELDFSWKVNELTSAGEAGDPSALSFTTEGNIPNATISASVTAININNSAEAAESNARFSLK